MDAWLKNFKGKTLAKFQKMPSENSELFKYQTGFKDFEKEVEVTDLTESLGMHVISASPKISIGPIAKSDFQKYLERFDINDKFVQMNNASFDCGVLIEVPENLDGGVLRISSSPDKNLFSKMIIILNEGASLNIVKESYSKDGGSLMISEDVLVVAGINSKLNFAELQNYNRDSVCMSNKISVCGKDSRVNWTLGNFGGGKTRTRTYNFLEGDGSEVEDLQLTFGDGTQYFDAFSNLSHIGKHTTAKSMAKGAFKDKSSSIFKGMIKINEPAKNASSYLACHSMLLSKDAKANAIPSLEIETNDVKATHAASVLPIDEEKIFYLVCRGISREDARKMITLGFFDPLILKIESEEIRAKMRYLIDMKWRGEKTESFEEKLLKEFVTEDAIKSGDVFEGHYKYR